jgi:branched-chain amino acid transport system ATP-binding protein
MTVLENLMLVPEAQLGEKIFAPWFLGKRVLKQEHDVHERALEVLDFVKLTHVKDEYAGNLSGGQKKLVELGRSMMASPKLILLDEPGAGVNPTLMKKLVENIRDLRDNHGISFLLIEHDMDLVMDLCHPIVVMSEGSKLMEGTADEVRNDQRVLEAYLGGQYAAS